MFNESNYDGPEFTVAPNGMNQFISPDALPSNFCHILENIIPSPLGVGQVRYGTSLTKELTNPEFSIMRAFNFVKKNIEREALLYVAHYSNDADKVVTEVPDESEIVFNSPTNKNRYIKDTKIKIVYTYNGSENTLYSGIEYVSILENSVTINLGGNLLPNPNAGELIINQIWYQAASIYSYNFKSDQVSPAPLMQNLSVACVPRCTYFAQNMFIFNGVDDVMYYDGEFLRILVNYVLELGASNITRIDNRNFSFNAIRNFDESKYYIGNIIELRINGQANLSSITNLQIVGNLVTITTLTDLPEFAANQATILYRDKPPAFSYMYVAHDRIWALGPGPVGLEYRDGNEQLRVYYSYLPNSIIDEGLFNQNTKTVPSINIADKHNIQDNLEAICQINGLMVFIGRNSSQVWSGNTPGTGGNFSWNATIPAGIFHGDLLIELANDIYFVSQTGVQSFSTLNVARQFSASPVDAVNPIVKKFISQASSSNAQYRKCTSFKYDEGAIAGFKIGGNKILASLFTTNLYSWFYLSGDFAKSNCFMVSDKQFYLFIGNKIYKYANGSDGTPKKYGDQNGKSLISVIWMPALIKFRGRKGYANKRYEVVIDYPSSFTLNQSNMVELSILGDTPRNFSLTDRCVFDNRGDLLNEEPLVPTESRKDGLGFRLKKEYKISNKRLKFTSSSFWLSVSGYVMNGPVTFRRVRLFGIGERNA